MTVASNKPVILLPEPDDLVVAKFIKNLDPNNSDYQVRSDQVSLDESAEMLKAGEVDAVVVGATYSSKEVFLAAIRKVGASNKDASSFFVMEKDAEPTIYLADCAVNIEPGTELIARIAEQTTANVKRLGDEPVVAFLSYSTLGSAGGPSAEKMKQALTIFKGRNPLIPAYGELQWDSATSNEIYKKKTGSDFLNDQKPNVFIFPNLDAGNMMYKALERPGGYTAIGPLIQGLDADADFHDLSRGVTVDALERICQTVAKLVRAKHDG